MTLAAQPIEEAQEAENRALDAARPELTDRPPGLHPPRPRLALSVAISGHRFEASEAEHVALEHAVDGVLGVIRESVLALHDEDRTRGENAVFDANPPVLRLVSPLAEGADRLVARRAVRLGFRIECPLPFPREQYAADFPGSVHEFDELLREADSVLELDGVRDPEGYPAASRAAYLETGRMVLRNCDLLLAIWDGAPAKDTGGTAQIIDEARNAGIPVVWVLATAPHTLQVSIDRWLWTDGLDPLAPCVQAIALGGLSASVAEHRPEYFTERERFPFFLGVPWLLFRSVIELSLQPLRGWRADGVATLADAWRTRFDGLSDIPPKVKERMGAILEHSAWACHLATQYGLRHRSSIVLTGFFAVVAVTLALVGGVIFPKDQKWPFVLAEVIVLVVLLVTVACDRLRSWHDKWLSYRLLAEHLRQSSYLALLGRASPPRQAGARPDDLDDRHSWTSWMVRSVTRLAGLPPTSFTDRYLNTVVDFLLEDWIDDQIAYHGHTADRLGRLARRVELFVLGSVLLTVVVCVLFLVWHWDPSGFLIWEGEGHAVTLITAGLPALSAGLMSILFHAEIERVAKRSHDMQRLLKRARDELARLKTAPPVSTNGQLRSTDIARRVDALSRLMMHDVLDWRIMLAERAPHVG